ncbi:MAG: DUF3795 domain-containing protein [Thermodesulfobacteriota bacterium]
MIMYGSDQELTAYCGLYCGDCLRFQSKVSKLATELSKELEKSHFEDYAHVKGAMVPEFLHYHKITAGLKAMSELYCGTPCRQGGDGCGKPCEIKTCVHKKGIAGCWQCDEAADCHKFNFLEPFHGKAPRENLRKIRKYGLENWTLHREKCYPWL